MTRLKRWVLWGTAAIVLIVVGLAVYGYFIGTQTLLERAEAFSFRRMAVTQLPEESTYRFFYTSNRVLNNEHGDVGERFGTERETSLKFGSFATQIEPALGLGMIINPSDWLLNEEIQLVRLRGLEQQAFVSELRNQVERSKQRSLLVVVHGFRESFPTALRRTAFIAHVLDIDTPVLVFDWPGNQGSSLRGYRRAREVAEASGAELAATLELIIEEVQPERLWLMANSMGAQVVVDAFSVLYENADLADAQTEIEDVVLTAADVDHEEFNDRFKHQIKALAGNVTVYVSSNDRALLVSRVINRGMRLGESTLDPGNPSQAEETARLVELLEPGNDQLVLVDVTPVNRTRNFHNFSLETPEFFDDLFLRFTGSGLPYTRELHEFQTATGTHYFVLTRAR